MEKLQLGQDGLGQAFIEFQKKIKKLKDNGLLLAVASKNNLEDDECNTKSSINGFKKR